MSTIHPQAGKAADKLIDVSKLQQAYYDRHPNFAVKAERVLFGTSGHRGSSLKNSFNEDHILAITEAICLYRARQKIVGPLFLGIDTHALSIPAMKTAVEVLAAHGVTLILAERDEYTPTPVISHAILSYNKGRKDRLADGIVITPSHNPPEEGGFKYNPPHGGPAESEATSWIEKKANELLGKEGTRISYEKAVQAKTTHRYNYIDPYVADLNNVIDMWALQNLSLGVDPLGGAGVHYWEKIADNYQLKLNIVNTKVDPTFRFMTLDWDGKIRMDPSSVYAMKGLIGMQGKFDIAFACDTDHDRHGIVTKSSGLMPPNHFLAAALFYLFLHRPKWKPSMLVGKTIVSSQMIDKVAGKLGRKIYETPVGFKWFVEGLLHGEIGFAGEESAGASFLRKDGTVWTTDKDGIILALLAAEILGKMKRDPAEIYQDFVKEFGESFYERVDAVATVEEKEALKKVTSDKIVLQELAGDTVESILTTTGHGPIGGIKVVTQKGWFAARPSGTEAIYKIYAESFVSRGHLQKILKEATTIIKGLL